MENSIADVRYQIFIKSKVKRRQKVFTPYHVNRTNLLGYQMRKKTLKSPKDIPFSIEYTKDISFVICFYANFLFINVFFSVERRLPSLNSKNDSMSEQHILRC